MRLGVQELWSRDGYLSGAALCERNHPDMEEYPFEKQIFDLVRDRLAGYHCCRFVEFLRNFRFK